MDDFVGLWREHRLQILAVALGVALLLTAWFRRETRLNTIPGPRVNPFYGLGFDLPTGASRLFREWAYEYGELFRVRVGWYDWLAINSPEAIREILEKQAVSTSSKAPSPLGHGVVTGGMRMPTMPYGRWWRAQRSVVRNITSVPMTTTFVPSQEFETKQLLYDLATNNEDQRKFFMHMRRYAFSIILTNTFGTRVQDIDHPDVHYAMRSQAILRSTLPPHFIVDELPPLQKLPKWMWPGRREAEAAAKEVLDIKMNLWRRLEKQHEAGAAPACYGREILENKENWYAQGLTEQDLAWVAGGLVEAGFETSAATLNNLAAFLAENPRAQATAHQELMDVVGEERLPTFEELREMPYVRACVKETLRLRPILTPGIRHYTDADVVYKEHVIPKGTVLLANTTYLHFDPRRFEKPFEFMPERYLSHEKYSSEYAAMADPFKRDHFTFSTGRRTCPGARVAENSLGIALAGMLWAFEIRRPEVDGAEVPIDLSDDAYTPGSFAIRKPFAARFVPRSERRLDLVKTEWERAQREGYELRGVPVGVEGVMQESRVQSRVGPELVCE